MKKFILLNTVLLICSLSFAQDRLHAALDTDDYETAISITDSLLNAATDSVQVKRLTINKAQYLKKLYKYDEAISAITSLSPGWLLDDPAQQTEGSADFPSDRGPSADCERRFLPGVRHRAGA